MRHPRNHSSVSGRALSAFVVGILMLAGLTLSGCGYPSSISFGARSANGASASGITISHNNWKYTLTGKSSAPKEGEMRFEIKIESDKSKGKNAQDKTVTVTVPSEKGKAFSVAVDAGGKVTSAKLVSFAYEPYEFTSKDYPKDPGLKLVYYSEKNDQTAPFPIAFNMTGPWDFSAGPTEGEVVYQYVAPKAQPQSADFPSANAARSNDQGKGVTTVYWTKSPDSELFLGSATKTLLSEVSAIEKYDPPEVMYKFPFKVGDTWQSQSNIADSGLSSGSGTSQNQTKVVARNNVKVPQGEYSKCYLVQYRYHDKYSDGTDINKIEYIWLVPGVGPVAYLTSVNGEQVEQFTQASSFWRLKFKGKQ